MTVLLPLDAAYALDYYAILLVKGFEGLPVSEERHSVLGCLKNQIDNLPEILEGPEFNLLLMTNQETFEAINKAHRDELSASEVQKVNRRRYEAKVALQKRFWPTSELREVKSKV